MNEPDFLPDCDCIIPFFNEEPRVFSVLDSVLNVKGIGKIIAVDDGSTDKRAYSKMQSFNPRVIAVRLETNGGKAAAVKAGLEYAGAQNVLLLDADLTNIKTNELENAINLMEVNSQIDMIILRRVEDNTSLPWLRQDIVTSGQRLLRRDDLVRIFENNISGYQLEVAINAYMIRNHKRVYWMPFSIHGPWRTQKWSRKDSLKQVARSARNYLKPIFLRDIVWQSLFFCREQAPR
jgi:glycosyltransferase involved in cell wall biosynthesis